MAPFAGFAVGGGGHSTADYNQSPPPAGTGQNAGPARSSLRVIGQDGRPAKNRFIKVVPPGQFPAMAPPYSWEPHERADWKYPQKKTNGQYPKKPKNETRFFSSKLVLVELEFKRTPGVALPDPAKQQVIQLHTKAKMIRDQIAQLRVKAHQLVQAHKQKQQQAQQFKTADKFKMSVGAQQQVRQRDATQRARWRGSKVTPAIQKYRTMQQPAPAVSEDDENEPFGLEGGTDHTYLPAPERQPLPARPPAATSPNPQKAARQAGAWFRSVGKPKTAKAEPIGLTQHPQQKRPADPETLQLLGVHQRVAQLRQQLAGIMNQIKMLRGRQAPKPA